MNNKFYNNKYELFDWIIVLAGFIFFWPLGIFLLFKKLSGKKFFNAETTQNADKNLALRIEKYLFITKGQATVPISQLASANGISYESALREIQQMLTQGYFGKDAYINYLTKTLVLRASASSVSRPNASSASPSGVSAAAASKPSPANTPPKIGSMNVWLEMLFLILGISLIAVGIAVVIPEISSFIALGFLALETASFWHTATTAFLWLSGIIALSIPAAAKKRVRRYNKYTTVIGDNHTVGIDKFAKAAGVSRRTVINDLEAMIEKRYLGAFAYIDIGKNALVLSPEEQNETKAAEDPSEDKYCAILKEIDELNASIRDTEVSERIYIIKEITQKIFRIIKEKPEKLPQIKSFMSYYLPTTLKLLRSYSLFEKQDIKGENIDLAKQDIERILDTLVRGFSQQLDQLFKSDAIDISTDIDVLEGMMRKDGLAGDNSGFQSLGGH